jgi:hypothetical protein
MSSSFGKGVGNFVAIPFYMHKMKRNKVLGYDFYVSDHVAIVSIAWGVLL